MVRIVRAIFGNENSILTVSTMPNGEYGEKGVYVGLPSIVNRNGIGGIIELSLNEEERDKLHHSCELLRSVFSDIGI